jgi:hypothetical protein
VGNQPIEPSPFTIFEKKGSLVLKQQETRFVSQPFEAIPQHLRFPLDQVCLKSVQPVLLTGHHNS